MTGVTGVTGPVSTLPNRSYGTNVSLVTLTASPIVIASATLTPVVTGKIKISITGVGQNLDSVGTLRPITLSVTDGTNTLQTQSTVRFAGAAAPGISATLAIVVDSDLAVTTPTTYALGTPITINAVATGDASGNLTISARGMQIEIQEAAK